MATRAVLNSRKIHEFSSFGYVLASLLTKKVKRTTKMVTTTTKKNKKKTKKNKKKTMMVRTEPSRAEPSRAVKRLPHAVVLD